MSLGVNLNRDGCDGFGPADGPLAPPLRNALDSDRLRLCKSRLVETEVPSGRE
jgi:hypothetical protein